MIKENEELKKENEELKYLLKNWYEVKCVDVKLAKKYNCEAEITEGKIYKVLQKNNDLTILIKDDKERDKWVNMEGFFKL